MKFFIAIALLALIAISTAVVVSPFGYAAPFGGLGIPAGVVPVGYAGGPASVVAPGVVREYHGAPLIHGYYSGLVA